MKTENLTPEQVLLTDEIANEKYVGFYAERKLSRMVIATGSVLLLGSFGAIVSLAHRPVQTRYIRIDEMGKATAIQYSDLAYSPREGEVRTLTVELLDGGNVTYDPRRLRGVNVFRETEREFAVGDRIQVTAPNKKLGIANRGG